MQRLLTSNFRLLSDQNEIGQPRICVGEKIKQLKREIANIKTAKEAFLENFSITNKNIENMTGNISRCVEERGQTLKRRLQDIWKEKITEWDRQLELCHQAEQNITDSASTTSTPPTFNESIGFIDSGDIIFEVDMSVLNKMKNFGTVSNVDPRRPKFVIGGEGQKTIGFSQPWGVCSDATGRILVADSGNNRIQVFNEFGELLFRFGDSGSRPGEFRHPRGIAIDRKLRIFVSDTQNHRIQVFTYKGRFLTTFGQEGTDLGQFSFPHDVAVNERCEIAVSDTGNRRIQLFTPHGKFITHFCFAPKLDVSPWGIAFRADASLMVTDAQNHRLLTIDKEFTTANPMNGADFYFGKAQGIACDCWGGFAVADGDQIKFYDDDGVMRGLFDGVLNSFQGVCYLHQGSFAAVGKDSVLVF